MVATKVATKPGKAAARARAREMSAEQVLAEAARRADALADEGEGIDVNELAESVLGTVPASAAAIHELAVEGLAFRLRFAVRGPGRGQLGPAEEAAEPSGEARPANTRSARP